MNVQNVVKYLGLISVILALVAVAYPMPDLWKIYILGTETVINGVSQYVSSSWLMNPQTVKS